MSQGHPEEGLLDQALNRWSLLDDLGGDDPQTITSLDALLAHRTPDPNLSTPIEGDGLGINGGDSGLEQGVHRVQSRSDATAGGEIGLVVGDLRYLPIESIRPNEFQPRRRFDEAQLAALTESVRELGVLQPVLVREIPEKDRKPGSPVEFELVAGERRWRASRRAGLGRVPALVRELSDLRSLEEAIVENLHRSDLNALEEAAAYQQLIDEFGLSHSQVASRVGRSRSAVANTLRLTQLPVSVQRMVVDGTITAGHARAILAVPSYDQRVFAERVVEEALSVRGAEQMAQNWAETRSTRPGGSNGNRGPNSGSEGRGKRGGATGGGRDGEKRSAGAYEVESQLEAHLDTRVTVTETAKGGRIVIDFADDEDLGRIFGRLLERPTDDA